MNKLLNELLLIFELIQQFALMNFSLYLNIFKILKIFMLNISKEKTTISKAMIKFWSTFHFQIFWYSFTGDNKFLLTSSLIFPRKILPPAPLDTSATVFVCIFSSILNSIMEGWKYRSKEVVFKSYCLSPKKPIRQKTFSWNLHDIFFRNLHEMSQPSCQNQQNGKETFSQTCILHHGCGKVSNS